MKKADKLSGRQQKIFDFIRRFFSDRNYPPTIREIVNGCGISSTSVADYNLDVLEKKGLIRRHPGISRGIEMIARSGIAEGILKIPVIGQIAAGEPIPVPAPDTWDIAAISETMDIPEELAHGRSGIYALKVKGTSMIDALINDGDTVLMQHSNVVENGEMAAVWLRAEKEVTLKKVYREKDRIRLQPANSNMKPIYAEPDNIEVQGRVIAVIRKLS